MPRSFGVWNSCLSSGLNGTLRLIPFGGTAERNHLA